MCWSARGSLATYLFALILGFSALLYKNMPIPLFIFMMVFTHMQLVEYFLWKNMNNSQLNEFWSKMGAFLLFIEPLAAIYMIPYMKLKIILAFIYLIGVLIYVITHKTNYRTKIAPNGHLQWMFIPDNIVWIIIWMSFFFGSFLIIKRYDMFLAGLLILLISIYNYRNYNAWTTMWCWLAIASWITVYI